MTDQKTGVGAYTDKPFVCITHNFIYMNHRVIKKGGGCLHRDGHLCERIQYNVPDCMGSMYISLRPLAM